MQDFRKLIVWQKAQRLAVECHRIAIQIRGAHYAAVRSQIIRSSMSIPANIAEGRGQRSDREFARFLNYSLASANELESHLSLCRSLGLAKEHEHDSVVGLTIEVRRMLHAMMKRIATSRD
jgi:four helix bundle protein